MRSVFNAAYLAIFIVFARRILDRLTFCLEHGVPFEKRDDSDEFYVMLQGTPVQWKSCREDADGFCWLAISKCRSLEHKLKIVETAEEIPLVDAGSLPGVTIEEAAAVDSAIDETE